MADIDKGSSWPGEREPSHRDVAVANERPDPVLLSNFKRALLQSDDAVGTVELLHMGLRVREQRATGKYTYPLALLSHFPGLPPADRITQLCRLFSRRCSGHLFFEHFPQSALTRESIAPLRFGVACLSAICSRDGVNEAQTLFSAGASLWPVLVEVDNSLARSAEMLLAVVLLIPCGILAGSETAQNRVTLLLSSTLTVARRMRLHHPGQLEEPALRQRVSSYSPMLWSLWLWDIIHGLNSDNPLTFSVEEVLSTMPASTVLFQHVYRDLLKESSLGRQSLLETTGNVSSRDQAALLLFAILSDSITMRRSLGSSTDVINTAQWVAYKHNPFTPGFAHSELERIQGQLSLALDRWYNFFASSMSPDILALYQYCRLYLSHPGISRLHQAVNSLASQLSDSDLSNKGDMLGGSDQSVNHAWTLLDAAATLPKSQESLSPAWMPIVIFHAALVVWGKITFDNKSGRGSRSYGSVRTLLAFRVELETMHWPCCARMVATLDMLMSGHIT